ncbi:MAG TPA: dihydropteroate synthase [Armatimonadota bacterium]|jgi:dihydropteroate synthase
MNRTEPAGDRVRRSLNMPWKGEFRHPTLVMGIVNVTPDSFQSVGRHNRPMDAVEHGLSLFADGADILDVGGESSRPGAPIVPVEEELERVIPVVQGLAERSSVPISVDTRKSEVAEAAIRAGARIINDVSAGRFDAHMFRVVAESDAFICLMHGPLDTTAMQWSTAEVRRGADIAASVAGFLSARAEAAVSGGIDEDRIWVDPGFGFGKTVGDNLRLIRDLNLITCLPWPVMVGTSRKSTLGAVLNGAAPEDRLEATLATVALAIRSGAAIVRVHDVAAAVRTARTADAIVHCGQP